MQSLLEPLRQQIPFSLEHDRVKEVVKKSAFFLFALAIRVYHYSLSTLLISYGLTQESLRFIKKASKQHSFHQVEKQLEGIQQRYNTFKESHPFVPQLFMIMLLAQTFLIYPSTALGVGVIAGIIIHLEAENKQAYSKLR